MEAAITSTVSRLRCSPNPTLARQQLGARAVGFIPQPQSHGVRCKRSTHQVSRAYAAAAGTEGGDAGSVGMERKKKRLVVFVSDGGSNFREIHDATLHERDIIADCGGAKHARASDIPVGVFPNSKSVPEGYLLMNC